MDIIIIVCYKVVINVCIKDSLRQKVWARVLMKSGS